MKLCSLLYMCISILSGERVWLGSLTANETMTEGTTPVFKPILPDSDEVLPAAQHFAVALASLRTVS